MFVLVCTRVVKVATSNQGADRYAARSANRRDLYVSGPFSSRRLAERAALTALDTHTCLDAQVWSAARVRAGYARGRGQNGDDLQAMLSAALKLLDDATAATEC